MACRFPGAANPSDFWKVIRENRRCLGEIPDSRWNRGILYGPDGSSSRVLHQWRGGFVDGTQEFDWRAFSMLPREARHMDPQHRLLLELAWEGLEDAGFPIQSVRGEHAGVFVGIQWNDFARLLARDWSRLDGYAAIGNDFSFAANRISYSFGLNGPSLAVSCGCASSLAALQLACQSLWAGNCDLAIAAGVELILAPESSLLISATGVTSKRGECRTLDAEADGFVRGEGAGLVVLKPFSRLSPSDRPYAMVRGIALSHNGHNEWISASSGKAQQLTILEACRCAGASPSDLDYVELHAPGNSRGDAVELCALLDAVRPMRRGRPCLVGSIKPNLGHAGSASGMASLLKVALALRHREIPPSVAPAKLHPIAAMRQDQFLIPSEPVAWPPDSKGPLAGVTALSMGGVNAHAVLAAASVRRSAAQDGRWHLLTLSAGSSSALACRVKSFIPFLHESGAVEDICYTAAARRSHYAHRLCVLGRSAEELARSLGNALSSLEGRKITAPPRLIWRFSADGWKNVKDSDVFREERGFRNAYWEARRDLPPQLRRTDEGRLFGLQIASASLWRSWGVPCDAIEAAGSGIAAADYFARPRTRKRAIHLLQQGAFEKADSRLAESRDDNDLVLHVGTALDRLGLLRMLGEIYNRGLDVNWMSVYGGERQVVSLPLHPWERERMWPAGLDTTQISTQPGGENMPQAPRQEETPRMRLRSAVELRQSDLVTQYVRGRVGEALGTDGLQDRRPLTEYGLTSLVGIEIKARMERELGIRIPTALLLQAGTVEAVASHIYEQLSLGIALASVSADDAKQDGAQEVIRL